MCRIDYLSVNKEINQGGRIMIVHNLDNIDGREIVPGFHGKFIHAENMTIAHWDIRAGSPLPEHTHVHEQVVNVMKGTLELTVKDETQKLSPGSVVVIPSNVPHSGKAVTDCKVIDVFYPVREDYQ
jgi:quercetin dioxygenase-like cupin family protein